jgi:hypothetical protein
MTHPTHRATRSCPAEAARSGNPLSGAGGVEAVAGHGVNDQGLPYQKVGGPRCNWPAGAAWKDRRCCACTRCSRCRGVLDCRAYTQAGVYAINGRAVACRRPLAPLRLERQSGTAGLAVISMQRVDVRQLDVERQPDLIGPMFGCGLRAAGWARSRAESDMDRAT